MGSLSDDLDISAAATKSEAAMKVKAAAPAATVPAATPAPAEKKKCGEEALAAFRARQKKERETKPEESRTDPYAYEARLYRVFWNDMFAGEDCGSYEDTTSIPPMCFTDGRHHDDFVHEQNTLQIFSVKIKEITGGLKWPLDVYGMVAARDVVDHNRNIIFHRERENSQRITEEDPFLALTGPTRAILLSVDPTYVEVDLKVKGALRCEDRDLSFLALPYHNQGPSRSYMMTYHGHTNSKLSTLGLAFAHIVNSVEATISMEVIRGDWPRGFRGVFTANTTSMNDMKATLLAFEDGKLPVEGRSKIIKLSRRVVCVEVRRPEMGKGKPKLKISAQAIRVNRENDVWRHGLNFTPDRAGRSQGTLKVGSCEMQVTVAWSLLSTFKCSYELR